MIVLDTNVISELMRPQPNRRVTAWVDARPASELFATAIAQAEIFYGISLLPRSRRRDALLGLARGLFDEEFEGRVLVFDGDAAEHYATIAASRRRAGRPIATLDAQIAAIVRTRDATLATRNVGDFETCDIEIVDPWSAE